MRYWIKRILLQSGEVVTECELRADQNLFNGPVPVVGDMVNVECRGRTFAAKVIWGHWPGRNHAPDMIVPLRVEEHGFDAAKAPERFPPRRKK
ncbi:hypothetical protein ACM0P6_06680 [Komagataeibacter sucrofermentans]|uniref:Uncharacterized protein n=1 Tax=Komagataeibacter sucrofermentans TaxID=1053551 RepID=A0A318QLV5_9PROT|nr:hypothetical protein [Komagataeibacter sucrofermentans]PYD80667.1 hypothetical protein CFR77_01835 [Komagataeibacter sucrofermentans]